ncbi:MAG: hypothetical protein NC301_07330 [Bacteroides sp.]|nr:hypothetical protein [Bacteroides sp.]MCM1380022.1 hypothetical protein [Bacteroides sp.]MCM1446298.1 hypothetical protein [Prevotella sp.]
MQIFINNKPAAIKQGTSFEYVAENPLFSGSEGYSLAITLPLRGCAQNLEIFGNINRQDVQPGKLLLNGSIVDRNLTKYGSFAITEISNEEVKVQFLEGRSESNYDTMLDKLYINELDLGQANPSSITVKTPEAAWRRMPFQVEGIPAYACLPYYLINGSNVDVHQGNCAMWGFNDKNEWGWMWPLPDTNTFTELTYQPYLLHILRQICKSIGFSYDFTQLERYDAVKYLVICNTLPASYGIKNFARALPHWTVQEFFHQVELLLGGDFVVDYRARTVKFNYWRYALEAAGKISLDKVLQEHSVSVSIDEADCEYLGAKAIKYKSNDGYEWPRLCCPDFVDFYAQIFNNSTDTDKGNHRPVITYPSLSALVKAVGQYHRIKDILPEDLPYEQQRGLPVDALLYAEKEEQYFMLWEYERTTSGDKVNLKLDLVPVNIFGARVLNEDDAEDEEELSIVPARVERYWKVGEVKDFNQRAILHLKPKSYEEETEKLVRGLTVADFEQGKSQPWPQQALTKLENKIELPEYYDKIFIAWFSGWSSEAREDKTDNANVEDWPPCYLPAPQISEYYIREDLSYGEASDVFSLRLNSNAYLERTGLRKVDPHTKATFKFLSDAIPSPRAIFNIRGKRYLCAKITATFTEAGMSQLLTGEFYPLVD